MQCNGIVLAKQADRHAHRYVPIQNCTAKTRRHKKDHGELLLLYMCTKAVPQAPSPPVFLLPLSSASKSTYTPT